MQGLQELRGLVAAARLDLGREVAIGHGLGDLQRLLDRARDAPGDQNRERGTEKDGTGKYRDDPAAGRDKGRIAERAGGLSTGDVVVDQALERRRGAVVFLL